MNNNMSSYLNSLYLRDCLRHQQIPRRQMPSHKTTSGYLNILFFLAGCFVIFTLFFGLFLGASDCIIRLDLETENKMVSDKVTFIPLHYHR